MVSFFSLNFKPFDKQVMLCRELKGVRVEPKSLATKKFLHRSEILPQQIFPGVPIMSRTELQKVKNEKFSDLPVEVQEAGELVDLDARTESSEVNGVDGLLDQGKVVPNEAGHEDVLLIVTTEDALGNYGC